MDRFPQEAFPSPTTLRPGAKGGGGGDPGVNLSIQYTTDVEDDDLSGSSAADKCDEKGRNLFLFGQRLKNETFFHSVVAIFIYLLLYLLYICT